MKLKGHTIIELTDVGTGEVETVESDNMFTNALSQIFNGLAGLYSASMTIPDSSDTLKLAQHLLGGLLLFDTALEEDVNNVFAPAGTTMVGCAAYNNSTHSTLPTTQGTYNVTESEMNEGNVKFVYDFTTSQANGTIAAVCLTSLEGGFAGYGTIGEGVGAAYRFGIKLRSFSPYTPANTVLYTGNQSTVAMGAEVPFCYDESNRVLYCAVVTKETITITIYDDYNNIYLLRPVKYKKQLESYTVYLPTLFTNGYYHVFYNSDEQTLYFWDSASSTGPVTNNTTKIIYELNLNTKELKSHTFNNETGVTIYPSSFMVHNGYLYAFSVEVNSSSYSSNYNVYKINLSSSEATTIPLGDLTSTYKIYGSLGVHNGLIYVRIDSYIAIIDTVLDCVKMTRCLDYVRPQVYSYSPKTCVAQYGDSYRSLVGSPVSSSTTSSAYEGYVAGAFANYLATINNLETPVVKTASKTMKVTYIIEEEEEV